MSFLKDYLKSLGFWPGHQKKSDDSRSGEADNSSSQINYLGCNVILPQLPDEIWESILSMLPIETRCRFACVSKPWNERAWKNVTSLNLALRHRYDQELIIISIMKKCKKLRYLTLTDCYQISGLVLRHLPKDTLERFRFTNCPKLSHTVTNDDLVGLPSSLVSLQLRGCLHVTDQVIASLPRELRDLDCGGCSITSEGIYHLPPTLQTLSLARCNRSYLTLLALPSTLTQLDLSFNNSLLDTSIEAMPESLRILNLSFCKNLTDNGISRLAAITHLKTLYLDGCRKLTGEGSFSNLPPSLQILHLRHCKGITDAGLAGLQHKLILELDIWGCDSLTDLSQLPSYIQSINLCRLPALNDKTCVYLPNGLKEICFFGCSTLTDKGLANLQCAKSIEVLDIGRTSITDSGLELIAKEFTSLRRISLGNCAAITQDGLLLFSNNAPNVQVFKGICK